MLDQQKIRALWQQQFPVAPRNLEMKMWLTSVYIGLKGLM